MPQDLSLAHPLGQSAAAAPVTASGPRAGFWRRFLAGLVDGLIFVAMSAGAFALGVDWHTLGFKLSLAVIVLVYFAVLEGRPAGQTLGKRVAGIRVMDIDTGAPLGIGRAAIRHLARAVSDVPLGIGNAWMLWDPERQAWHDKLSDSVVVPVHEYPL